MRKIKWIGLTVLISLIPILVAAQGDDMGAGPPKQETIKPSVKTAPKPSTPTVPPPSSAFGFLVVSSTKDAKINVNGEKDFVVKASSPLTSIPLKKGENYLWIATLDGKTKGYEKTVDVTVKDQRIRLSLEWGKEPEELKPTGVGFPEIARNEMVRIEGGWFEMGDTFGDGYSDQKPVHKVRVGIFLIGRQEVTFREFDAFCDDTGRCKPADEGWGRNDRPVVNVSWFDAVAFCNWRSRQGGLREVYAISGNNVTADWSANGYRLPTEAEWEYAARGGQNSKRYKYSGSNNLEEVAWYSSNSSGKTQPVKGKKPNELGIFDMSGNVWEWCWDLYESKYYESSPSENPKGPSSGSNRVLRGGSWSSGPTFVQFSIRNASPQLTRSRVVGIRLAKTP